MQLREIIRVGRASTVATTTDQALRVQADFGVIGLQRNRFGVDNNNLLGGRAFVMHCRAIGHDRDRVANCQTVLLPAVTAALLGLTGPAAARTWPAPTTLARPTLLITIVAGWLGGRTCRRTRNTGIDRLVIARLAAQEVSPITVAGVATAVSSSSGWSTIAGKAG